MQVEEATVCGICIRLQNMSAELEIRHRTMHTVPIKDVECVDYHGRKAQQENEKLCPRRFQLQRWCD